MGANGAAPSNDSRPFVSFAGECLSRPALLREVLGKPEELGDFFQAGGGGAGEDFEILGGGRVACLRANPRAVRRHGARDGVSCVWAFFEFR